MANRISELVIDCADPERLAAFWSELLGYVELGREDDASIEIGPPDVGYRDQEAELERLLALGARPADIGQTGAESWHVLADPEGNEFCLLHTRLQPL